LTGDRDLIREFIMTPEFDQSWGKLGLDDDSLKKLQEEILENPQLGSVIQGTGGLRKMRFALDSGKRGGIRVLYVDLVLHEEIYLITAYSKKSKEDLTDIEKKEIKKLIDILRESAEERRAKK
jgi:hypothetical protein